MGWANILNNHQQGRKFRQESDRLA